MTLAEAIAQQPAWVGLWLNWLLAGAFVLPLALLIWTETRLAGAVLLVASVLSAIGVTMLYEAMGYVKLLGLPHIVFWTPAAGYLVYLLRQGRMRVWPKRITVVILVTILVSLVFDYADVMRYILGKRTATALPAH